MSADVQTGINWHTGELHEDIITGHVFSGIRYVPAACDRFLEEVVHVNRDVLSNEDPLIPRRPVSFQAWAPWKVPFSMSKLITVLNGLSSQELKRHEEEMAPSDRMKLKGTVVPDVLLRGPGWNLVVEAEWSCDYNVPQLIEQALLAPDNLGRSVPTYILLVNRRVSPPGGLRDEIDDILRRCSNLGVDRDWLFRRMLWFNWQHFAKIFLKIVLETHTEETSRRILSDRITLLSWAGIEPTRELPGDMLDQAASVSAAVTPLLEELPAKCISAAARISVGLMSRIADVRRQRGG